MFIAAIGGLAIGMFGGFKIPGFGKFYQGFEVKPILTKIRLPPIVGMIIMGCVGRNYFGSLTKPFPNEWA